MKRDILIAGVLWLALTVVGLFLVGRIDYFPSTMSDKGEEVEHAFRVLALLTVPVAALVVTVLFYSVIVHRSKGDPVDDGPPIMGRGAFPMAWFGITSGLTLLVMIYPGLTSLAKMIDNPTPDLVVNVEGVQWTWLVSYPQQDVRNVRELVLPVDRTVRFDITSRDVLHSFWVPAFLMKIDAVPGKTTTVTFKPTETGTYQEDSALRLQCAELCGLSHSRMMLPVRVVTEEEFQAWVEKNRRPPATPAPTAEPGAEVQEVAIVAMNVLFDLKEIRVKAGSQVKLTVDNQDAGVPHNWALYESEDAAKAGEAPFAATEVATGPVTQELTFSAPEPGIYFFRCDVHPTTMVGTFTVE
ncbi:MAG TPA: cytochrome c oxidase subunit II [Dehalococcoidia bacterium]|nr:cytochrome c oxidase subunit II [Dehalococcoidia bacterium]